MKSMLPLPFYHMIYFNCYVVLLILHLQCSKIILSPLDPSLTPPQLLQEFQSSSLAQLSTKYQNKTNVFPNIMNFGVYF